MVITHVDNAGMFAVVITAGEILFKVPGEK